MLQKFYLNYFDSYSFFKQTNLANTVKDTTGHSGGYRLKPLNIPSFCQAIDDFHCRKSERKQGRGVTSFVTSWEFNGT